jgi:hypothetical protein
MRTKITARDVSVERGVSCLTLSALVSGFLVTGKYMGYTKREAIRLFVAEVNA